MAAAGGVGNANSKVNRKVFDWWIEHHQPILEKMIQGTSHTFQYYGGFALNLALGCGKLIDSSKLLECYHAGFRDINIHASDIDAKILGVNQEDEDSTIKAMLKRGSVHGAPKEVREDAKPIYGAIMHRASPGSQTILLGPDQIEEGVPIQYVVGYSLWYLDKVTHKHHYQLILVAIFKDGKTLKSQVLSELTPVSKNPREGDPIFKNTPIFELLTQFTTHQKFLEEKLKTSESNTNRTRKARVNSRINRIRSMLREATTFELTKKGGGRRLRLRRRGSVKK